MRIDGFSKMTGLGVKKFFSQKLIFGIKMAEDEPKTPFKRLLYVCYRELETKIQILAQKILLKRK